MTKKRGLRVVYWQPMTIQNFLVGHANHKTRADHKARATAASQSSSSWTGIADSSRSPAFRAPPTTSRGTCDFRLYRPRLSAVQNRNPACQRASLSMMGGFERSRVRLDAKEVVQGIQTWSIERAFFSIFEPIRKTPIE